MGIESRIFDLLYLHNKYLDMFKHIILLLDQQILRVVLDMKLHIFACLL